MPGLPWLKDPPCPEHRLFQRHGLPEEILTWALQNYFPQHFASINFIFITIWERNSRYPPKYLSSFYRLGLQGQLYGVCISPSERRACNEGNCRWNYLTCKMPCRMSDAGSRPVLSLFSFFPTTPMEHLFLEHLIDVFMIFLKLPLSIMKALKICPKGSGKLLSS